MENTPRTVRCAIYCRKSAAEKLDREGNSLDVQRNACLDFISAHRSEGWVALPRTYEDIGFSGGNMNRPDLQCLLADVKSGLIDRVVVYKFDRISRSVCDFSNIIKQLNAHGAEFSAATQPIDTGTSIGRMLVNILASFAQFERELISERMTDVYRRKKASGKIDRDRDIPYGLRRSANDPNQLVENEDEIKMLRFMVEQFGRGYGRDKVATLTNKAGYRMRHGKEWHPQAMIASLYVALRFMRDTPEFNLIHDSLTRKTGFYRVCNIDGARLVKLNPRDTCGWRRRVEVKDIEAGAVEQPA